MLKHASLQKYCVRKHREPDRSGWARWIVGSGHAEVNRRRKDKDLLKRADRRKWETEQYFHDTNSGPFRPHHERDGYWQEVVTWKGWDEWEQSLREIDPSEEE